MIGRAAFALMFAACASSHAPLPTGAVAPLPAQVVSQADAQRLRGLAPDFLARAERAQARAQAASEPDVAAEYAELARLLLGAAQCEADRVELERRLLVEEQLRDERLRELATLRYEALAPQLTAAGAPPSELQRARLSLAVARALGAEPAQVEQAEQRLARAARDPKQTRGAIEQAERVLRAVSSRSQR